MSDIEKEKENDELRKKLKLSELKVEMLETMIDQAEVLELSSMNNEAYKILSDFDKRMKYILKLKGILKEVR